MRYDMNDDGWQGRERREGDGCGRRHGGWHGFRDQMREHFRDRLAARMAGRGHGRDHDDGDRGGFRGGRHGFGRGGGRIFGPGDLRLVLLSLIGDQPRHGYELIKAVEDLFGGAYSPSPGSVYPILTLLEELGQIRVAASEGARKLFEITEEGRQVLAENRTLLDALLSRMGIAARSMAGARPPEAIAQAFQTLRTALALHPRAWSEAEVARVHRIIANAAAEIGTSPQEK
ncbi:MAG TPA: PadR family transcriptional regulator [Roseomonas sp.]|jgi:DNA-binding PadR family transcriptional regulator